MRGQVVIPKNLRKRLKIEHGISWRLKRLRTLLLKPYAPVKNMKESGKGIFGEPVKYQRKLRKEWDS